MIQTTNIKYSIHNKVFKIKYCYYVMIKFKFKVNIMVLYRGKNEILKKRVHSYIFSVFNFIAMFLMFHKYNNSSLHCLKIVKYLLIDFLKV